MRIKNYFHLNLWLDLIIGILILWTIMNSNFIIFLLIPSILLIFIKLIINYNLYYKIKKGEEKCQEDSCWSWF